MIAAFAYLMLRPLWQRARRKASSLAHAISAASSQKLLQLEQQQEQQERQRRLKELSDMELVPVGLGGGAGAGAGGSGSRPGSRAPSNGGSVVLPPPPEEQHQQQEQLLPRVQSLRQGTASMRRGGAPGAYGTAGMLPPPTPDVGPPSSPVTAGVDAVSSDEVQLTLRTTGAG